MTTSYDRIPQELKDRTQWVCYRMEDGTKVPRKPQGGAKARINEPGDWSTFERAERASSRYDGIEFMLSADDPYTFIDLDHCVNDQGEIEQWAMRIIREFNSYTEFSRSKHGIHIFIRGQKPGDRCRATKSAEHIEIYDHSRPIVCTGDLVPGCPSTIEPAGNELTELYSRLFPAEVEPVRSTASAAGRTITPVDLTDAELIQRACESSKTGTAFSLLWNGNLSEVDGDHSAGDQALCNHLAFWTAKDPGRMDRLFRQSGLMRDKWDSKRPTGTYGELAIRKAIATTRNVYTGTDGAGNPLPTVDDLERARVHLTAARKLDTAAAVYDAVPDMAILPEGEVADWLKERKEALGTALDLRDLRGKIKAAQRRTSAHKDQGLPVVSVSNRQLREVTTDALSALVAGNDPVTLFVRSGTVVRLRTRTHKGFSQPIIDTATPEIIRCHQSRTADYIKLTKDGNTVAVSPPLEVAKDILAVGEWEFPPLDAVTETPVLRPDGSILSAHGYDPATKLYYCPDPSLILPDVPEVPTPAQLHEAISLLADVIYDFPFVDGSDFANALAIMLTPVVRPAVDDCVPLAVITAPQPGTGKGLLAKTCAIVSTGRDASMMTAPVTTEEWKKSITTQLSEGATSIVLDNIELPLADPNLAAVLTASIWKDRQLGTNRQIEVPNRSVWVATGNNVKLGGDLPRRCYWIRLDPKTSEPEKRRGFRHTNLISYVTTNRGQILAALLTLCRHWFALGCPAGKGPIIGSFERWCQVIGGILSAAGVEDFMGNADTQRKAADEEGQRWLACLEELFATYSPGTFTVNQLNNDCISDDNLLASIPDEFVMTRERSEASFVRRLGRAFGKIDGKRFGPENLYIEKSGLMNCKTLWEVKKGAGDGGAEPIDPLEKLRRKVEPVAIDDSQVQGDEPGNPAADSGQIPFDSSDNVESGGKSNSLLVLTSKIQPRTCKTNISPPDRDIYVLHATGGKLPLQTSKLLDSADCEPKPAETGISSECDAESLKVTLTSVLDKLGWPSLKLDPWMRLGIGGKPTWLLWMNHPRTDSIDIWQVLELLKGGQE